MPTAIVTGVLYEVEIRNSIRSLGNRSVLKVDRGTLVLIHGYVFSKIGLHLSAAKVDLEQVNTDGTKGSQVLIQTPSANLLSADPKASRNSALPRN
jgi:hypothetical protein